MTAFKDLSIRRKLIWIITVVSTAAVLLVCLMFLFYDRMTFKETVVQNLGTLSEMIGSNTTAALLFNNPEDATETLASLKAENHIVAATIYLNTDQVFATYSRSNQIFTPPQASSAGHTFGKDYLDMFQPVMLDGEKIGTLYIRSDLKAIETRQFNYILLVFVCLLGISGLVLIITSRLQRIISDPILNLASLARRVSEKKTIPFKPQKKQEMKWEFWLMHSTKCYLKFTNAMRP